MYHYVYRITNNIGKIKKYYIGVRSCKCLPEDDSYMGSSKVLSSDIESMGKHNFKKEIICVLSDRESAMDLECKLLTEYDAMHNIEWYNLTNGNANSYHTVGTVTAKKIGENKYKQVSMEEYYTNHDNYTHAIKNLVIVKTDDGFKTITKDEFQLGNYDHVTKGTCVILFPDGSKKRINKNTLCGDEIKYWSGKIPVIDESNNTININYTDYDCKLHKNIKAGKVTVKDKSNMKHTISCEHYYNNLDIYEPVTKQNAVVGFDKSGKMISMSSEEYNANKENIIHINEGTISAYDLNTKTNVRIPLDTFYKNKNRYKNSGHLGIVRIYNAENELMFEDMGDFGLLCKINNLPYQMLQQSYLNNGRRIYSSPKSKTIAKNNDKEKFIGWYAKKEKINEL